MTAAASVLVVDDEVGMRDTLSEILAGAGYEVSAAEDGSAALRQLREGHFDVVVMDVRMPGMDGVATLEKIGPPPPPVIMMTAYALEEQLRRAMASQAYAVVHKPFGVPHLLRLVESALTGSTAGGTG